MDGDAPVTIGTDKSTKRNPRPDDNREPVCYHSYPTDLYQTILHDHALSHLLHFTAGDGTAAKAALLQADNN